MNRSSHELSLAIVTPSYAPDLRLCTDLNRSVLRHTSPDVKHYIIAPSRDQNEFRRLASDRTLILDTRQFLPRGMMKVPRMNAWLNFRHPFPPVRGWIAQQIVKLAAAAEMTTDIVLLVDSDVLLIRPVDASSFAPAGKVQLFEAPNGVNESLPRHHLWHAAARRLLGLPPLVAPILPDYVCWPCAWSPGLVRGMLSRIESVTGLPWATAIGRELHFSEMILYGVYVKELVGASLSVETTSVMRCVNHSDEIPLEAGGLQALLSRATRADFAVMVSAKSGTPQEIRSLLNDFRPPHA